MAQEWLKKYLRIKPEVHRIYDDLEQYLDYCRLHLLRFDEADLYKSEQYRKFDRQRQWKIRNGHPL